jgi:DNA-directed RNA polymerase specialized sigma subunit, sigma24 homolog
VVGRPCVEVPAFRASTNPVRSRCPGRSAGSGHGSRPEAHDGAPPAVALVFATIHRRAIDLGRRDQRRAGRELASAEQEPEAWFDTGVEDRERTQLIQDALGRLPEIYRAVITLKVWGELTFAEIAETLQIPANTAASRYRYGLEELRKLTKEVVI